MDSIENIELSILFSICGIILLYSTLLVFKVFVGYKELRSGIYSMILTTVFSEIIIGTHSILNGINGFINKNTEDTFCKIDATIAVFFMSYWVFQHFAMMFLFKTRKLENYITRRVHYITTTLSISMTIFLFFTNSLGISHLNTCLVRNVDNAAIAVSISINYILTFMAILYNVWFFFFRDTSKDRNIINGFNYFVLGTSLGWSLYLTNLIMIAFFNTYSSVYNYFVVIILNLSLIYIAYFRTQIEYVELVLKAGPSRYMIVNSFLFLVCMYERPNFKNIKKLVSVKLIEDVNEIENTLFQHIKKTSEYDFK
jgi:hypothetical protein